MGKTATGSLRRAVGPGDSHPSRQTHSGYNESDRLSTKVLLLIHHYYEHIPGYLGGRYYHK